MTTCLYGERLYEVEVNSNEKRIIDGLKLNYFQPSTELI